MSTSFRSSFMFLPESTSSPSTSSSSSSSSTTSSIFSKTGTVSRRTYNSDIDLAVHDLHIIDSAYLHPGYMPARHQGPANTMSSSSSSSSSTTPSPPRPRPRSRPRPPPPSPSSFPNSSDSHSHSDASEQVPRKLFRSYPSLKQRLGKERDVRDVRKSVTKKEGMNNAQLQIGRGYDGYKDGDDVEMEDVSPLDAHGCGSGSDTLKDEVETGYDGDTEMDDVHMPSLPSHEGKGASSRGGEGGSGGRKRKSDVIKQVQIEGEKTTNKSTSTGKKRGRCSDECEADQEDEEKEGVEYKRMRSFV